MLIQFLLLCHFQWNYNTVTNIVVWIWTSRLNLKYRYFKFCAMEFENIVVFLAIYFKLKCELRFKYN